jgi:hypothetical protein
MPTTTAGKNDAATGLAGGITHVSAMSDLGTTESSSARTAVSWAAASGGIVANSGALNIAMPASSTAAVIGLHSALTAGTQKGWLPIGTGAKKGVASVDTVANDTFQSDGHGLANTNRVFVTTIAGEALPTPLSAATLYFVVNVATDTFQLSTTSGGAAVDMTGLNEFAWFQTIPEVFTNAGNLTVAISALSLDLTFLG